VARCRVLSPSVHLPSNGTNQPGQGVYISSRGNSEPQARAPLELQRREESRRVGDRRVGDGYGMFAIFWAVLGSGVAILNACSTSSRLGLCSTTGCRECRHQPDRIGPEGPPTEPRGQTRGQACPQSDTGGNRGRLWYVHCFRGGVTILLPASPLPRFPVPSCEPETRTRRQP